MTPLEGHGADSVENTAHRIRYLDGLRGVAVIAVIGWHYYGATYAANLPYGDRHRALPFFGQGWLGVYLFFLISGFVIFRTLETSTDVVRFLIRRWIRLAPALLLCSVLLAAASTMLPDMPTGGYRVGDIAVALTFISPSFYHGLMKIDVLPVDGAYWTLVTEFSFYVIFGVLYFAFRWKRAVAGLIALWVIAAGLRYISVPLLGRAPEPLWWAGLEFFGWFASGALFYRAHEARSPRLYWLAVAIGLVCSLTNFRVVLWSDKAALLGVVVLFAASQRSVAIQKLLATRGLFFVGTVSYPLYLLHNHLGVGIIAAVGTRAGIGAPLVPVAVAGLLVLVAYAIHAGYEAHAASWLKRWLLPPRSRATRRSEAQA
ncbi:acyltransferase family protein [Sphingomonas phyllosphaerae]|uniref:acyltransferase family protein n=1 Tax=Sphingomonas phyllosphaerae TaxID=257003 RepID=UPI0003B6AF75|nr:acyltransferase [Sphingomonas phyllosphaerae]